MAFGQPGTGLLSRFIANFALIIFYYIHPAIIDCEMHYILSQGKE